MKNENRWRFPTSTEGEKGLDTTDMELFKKDPDGALAREICQNSIDAHDSSTDKPSYVEFQTFEIESKNIPGYADLRKQLKACYDFKKDDEKEGEQLKKMWSTINQSKIKCLRISDYNTTGLNGVERDDTSSPFYKLTKGSGSSNKNSGNGGSKGIGKFAAFVPSKVHTIFYSTRSNDGYKGYIGICKFRSVPVGEDPLMLTTGTGYYSSDESLRPIQSSFHLETEFDRGENSGTDIFVIGFDDTGDWQNKIIFKILDSFMVAILKNGFKAKINDIEVSERTVKDIIFNSEVLKNRTETEIRGVKAQYNLLTNAKHHTTIVVGKNSKVEIFVNDYTRVDEMDASKRIEWIRYPYMKIFSYRKRLVTPYSALCIIEDNELNAKLRKIENPEHTEWQNERLRDLSDEDKIITKELRKDLENQVYNYIKDITQKNISKKIDAQGAGEFLPSFETNGDNEQDIKIPDDQVEILPIQRVKIKPAPSKNTNDEQTHDGFSKASEGDESEGSINQGEDKDRTGGSYSGSNNSSNSTKNDPIGEGSKKAIKTVPIGGITFDYLYSKKAEKYIIHFVSTVDEDDVELKVLSVDEGNNTGEINITHAQINGLDCDVKEGKIQIMKLEKGKSYNVAFVCSNDGLMSIEVGLYAYRK